MQQGNAGLATHHWRFFRAGGFDQVRLDAGDDYLHLDRLDQKLWLALSCPVQGLEIDPRTLQMIDSDGDGQVRPPELIAATRWAAGLLGEPDLLARGAAALPLAAIRQDTEEGRRLLASARRILQNLGTPEASEISAAETACSVRIFAGTPFNGDGIITLRSAETPELARLIGEIQGCLGSLPDRSGEPGVDAARVTAFFAQARAHVDWATRPKREPGLLPAGEATGAAFAATAAVRAKVDDYFTRCRLVEYDPQAARALNGSQEEFAALAKQDLSAPGEAIGLLPLAVAAPGRPLPLGLGINPAWRAAMAAFRAEAVAALLGERERLAEAEWADLTTRLAAHQAWAAAAPPTPVATLGLDRLREILAADQEAALLELVARDAALEAEAGAVAEVDRLVRYVRDLAGLANNFVAFRDFYTRRAKAIFQAGSLYLDGRSFDLCVRVQDPGKHAVLATLSRLCLVYCDCVRGGQKQTIAAAVTDGDSDQLVVGRNGIFYDRQGRDWGATVVKIVEHPISIRQAFWDPYRRVARLLSEQIQKAAAARSRASEQKAAADLIRSGMQAADGRPAPPPPPPAPVDAARFAGIFAAIGLAIGAIGTALAAVVTGLLSLKSWQLPLAALAVVLAISGPSVLLAWFKLRQRNLGPLLDATGWAVNARARINLPFGASLTSLGRMPEGAERSLADPYAERRSPWPAILALLAALAAAALAWRYLRGA